MIYRPKMPRKLWDSWLFEWDGIFHLFYIEIVGSDFDTIGHAVSEDLLHWTDRPSIPFKGKPGEWNEGSTCTGMVVRYEDRFCMFIGANRTDRQVVGVYFSEDLDNWTPFEGNPILEPTGQYYLTEPVSPQFPKVDWRDPFVAYRQEDQHYHMLLFARKPEWNHADTGTVIAHLKSQDLLHWSIMPPVDAEVGSFYHAEVPELFEMKGRYYLLFCTCSMYGVKLNTPSRFDTTGTYYMVGESIDGPFALPDEYMLIGAGGGKMTSYVGRTISYQGERIFYHHVQGDVHGLQGTWGIPKKIGAEADGSLFLEYMPLMEKLETGLICGASENVPSFDVMDLGDWQRDDGVIVGKAEVVGSSCRIVRDVSDLHLDCRVKCLTGAQVGLVLRSADGNGVRISLNFERQQMEIGMARKDAKCQLGWGADIVQALAGGGGSLYRDVCQCDLQHGQEYRIRCFTRDEHFEVYLDDRWIFTAVLPEANKQGDVELVVERGEAVFSDLRLARIEPLP